MALTVRRARPSDVRHLLPQLQRFSQFFGGKHTLFPSMDVAEAIVSGLVCTHPFWVAESTGEDPLGLESSVTSVVGFIGGALVPHNCNPALQILQELFWWVEPEYRGTRAGSLLLDAYTAYGRENAHLTVMTLEHNSPVNPHTLEKRGYRIREFNYVLES